jgi:hypothetical protein
MRRTCRDCGLLDHRPSVILSGGGREPPIIHAAPISKCLLRQTDRLPTEPACRRFMSRLTGWTPVQHYERAVAIHQDWYQNRLALATFIVAVLSLAVYLAQSLGGLPAFGP